MKLRREHNRELEAALPPIALAIAVSVVFLADRSLPAVLMVAGFVLANVALSRRATGASADGALRIEAVKLAGNLALLVAAPHLIGVASPFWILALLPVVRAVALFSGAGHAWWMVGSLSLAPLVGLATCGDVPRGITAFVALISVGTLLRSLATIIRDSNERLRVRDRLFEAAPVMLLTTSIDGRITDCNPAAVAGLAGDRADLVGAPLIEVLLREREHEHGQEALERVLSDGDDDLEERRVELTDARGGRFAARWMLGAIDDAAGGRAGTISVVHDISESERVGRDQTAFVATVSHELRTPLTSISGALDLLIAGAAGALPAKATQLVELAQRNSRRLLTLVGDLLDLQRLEEEQFQLEVVVTPLQPVVAAAVEEVSTLAASAGVSMVFDAPSEPLPVLVDAARIAQVVTNLLANALKFSPRGGSVFVRVVELEEGAVRVDVVDEGPGIALVDQERLFLPFQQVDSSAARRHQGSGLGLAICRGILEAHGGEISVMSEPGEGATFSFDLPPPPD